MDVCCTDKGSSGKVTLPGVQMLADAALRGEQTRASMRMTTQMAHQHNHYPRSTGAAHTVLTNSSGQYDDSNRRMPYARSATHDNPHFSQPPTPTSLTPDCSSEDEDSGVEDREVPDCEIQGEKAKKAKKGRCSRTNQTMMDAAIEHVVNDFSLRCPELKFEKVEELTTANGKGKGGRNHSKLAISDKVLRILLQIRDGRVVAPIYRKNMTNEELCERLQEEGLRTSEEVSLMDEDRKKRELMKREKESRATNRHQERKRRRTRGEESSE